MTCQGSQHGPADCIQVQDRGEHSDHTADTAAAKRLNEHGSSSLESSPLCLAAMQLLAAAVPDALNSQSTEQLASGELAIAGNTRFCCVMLE